VFGVTTAAGNGKKPLKLKVGLILLIFFLLAIILFTNVIFCSLVVLNFCCKVNNSSSTLFLSARDSNCVV
jgi:hypothetical protein